MAPRILRLAALVGLLALSSACLSMEAPDQFLITYSGGSRIDAVAADESRLLVREFPNEHGGDLAFWSDALRNEFTVNRGYTLLEEGMVQDARGRDRWEALFEVGTGGATWRYLLSVRVTDGLGGSGILCAEYVAEAGLFDEHLGAVREAVATIDP